MGVVGKHPSLLRPSWSPHQHGGGDNGSIVRGSLVVAVISLHVDDPYVILCSPAFLCVYNDEDTFRACKKMYTKVEGKEG